MRAILKGATDQSVVIRIVDSGDGTPETGVTSATGGLDLKYRREGAATANLTESDLSALTDAHSDGGMLHIGAGYYRIDVPDAAFATGANGVLVFGTVTGMVVIGCYVHLVDYNPQDVLATQASVNTIDDFLDTEIAAILAAVDTEVASILSAVDTEVAAIKTQTDKLVFTVANELDVNVQSINDTALTGNGAGTPWGPA